MTKGIVQPRPRAVAGPAPRPAAARRKPRLEVSSSAGLGPLAASCAVAALALLGLSAWAAWRPPALDPGWKMEWVAAWYGVPGIHPGLLGWLVGLGVALGLAWGVLGALVLGTALRWRGRDPRSHARRVTLSYIALVLALFSFLTLWGDLAVHVREVVPEEWPVNLLFLWGLAGALPLPAAFLAWRRFASPRSHTDGFGALEMQGAVEYACPGCTRLYWSRYPPPSGWRCPQCA